MPSKNSSPNPGTYGCIRIAVIDDDWIGILSINPKFLMFENEQRVSILDYEVWVNEDDEEVIDYLNKLGIFE